MLPLIILLLGSISTLPILEASRKYIDPSVLGKDAPIACGSNPYPFYVSTFTMSTEGGDRRFEILCNYSSLYPVTALLNLSTGYYVISEINFLGGYISIFTGAIASRGCGVNNGSSAPEDGRIDLRGTPYTLSTRNRLTAIGCDDLLRIRGTRLRAGDNGTAAATSGCVSFCDNLTQLVDGSCSGLGCCQATIPAGLKSFNVSLEQIPEIPNDGGPSAITDNATCHKAFFVDQDSFHFQADNLWQQTQYNRVILEWVIGEETCEQAKKNPESFACQENSDCYNSPAGVGYRCNCSKGYHGNPYDQGGCKDIDECSRPKTNPCVGNCINLPGSATCSCPKGRKGDGRKQGTGCKREIRLEFAIGLGSGCLFALITGSLSLYWFLKNRELAELKAKFFRQNGGLFLQQQISSQGIQATAKIFGAQELQKATDDYNEDHVLGRGGYGTVYRGVLQDRRVVAIKKSRLPDASQVEPFINEVVILWQINHRNVVKLLGCCLESQVPLLVYEFISNGSLFDLIHGAVPFPWESRLRIAAETAGALAYLHSAASIPIIHRDVKSANILLDDNYTAKVADFGASRSVPFDRTHVTTLVQGTLGYLDPEYFHTSQLTEKSDVYSFGVVLAEILTREMPVSFARPEEMRNLAAYFAFLVDGDRLAEAIEPEVAEEDQLLVVARLARRCLYLKGEERPTMREVASELEGLRRFTREMQLKHRNAGESERLLSSSSSSEARTSLQKYMVESMDFPR